MISKPKSFSIAMAILLIAIGGWRIQNTYCQRTDSTQEKQPVAASLHPVALIGPFSNWLILKNLHKK